MEKDNEYWLSDIETGYSYRVSKEYYEQYMSMWEIFRPKVNTDKIIGTLMITGTAGELNQSETLKTLYTNGTTRK